VPAPRIAPPATELRVDNRGGATICAVRSDHGARRLLESPIAGHSSGVVQPATGDRRGELSLLGCDGLALWSGPVGTVSAVAIDYAAPGPARPLIWAFAVRAAGGIVDGGATTTFSAFQGEVRAGYSLGDYGVGLVFRAGVDTLGAELGSYSHAGTHPSAELMVALLGDRAAHGLFGRGAYFGVGAALMFEIGALTASLLQPVLWFADVGYVALEITGYVEPVGGFSGSGGGQGPFGALSLGLEVALSE